MKGIQLFFILIAFSISSTNVIAQVEDYGEKEKTPRRATTPTDEFEYDSENDGKKWDWTKARIGGNLGLAFHSGGLLVDASPTFGYKVHKMVELGAGMKIFYYKDEVGYYDGLLYRSYSYKDFIYGPIAYGRFNVWEGVFVMAQYEMANKETYQWDSNDRVNAHHLLLGGGYSSPIGNVGQVNISLLYNVIDSDESIYQFGTFGNFPLFLNVSMGFGINKR
ncbi:MAG: hypothetical protein GY751_04350 [Bacteroidetes bacterium]|nr:hypothetical protein [Bacteroidota bacterium]